MLVLDPRTDAKTACRLVVEGRVQGVGYRPFVYRIAHEYRVNGWVLNGAGRVEIHAEGRATDIERFAHALVHQAPPLARPVLATREAISRQGFDAFTIRASEECGEPEIHVPPDQFACAECLAELDDPGNHRHRYPFINCTQCGPRYTLIRSMPYDRPNTTMAAFPLCPVCEREYRDPMDRRFHAEPVACPRCGPQLAWKTGPDTIHGEQALAECVRALKDGLIVAARGIGGYHLICDPSDDDAVARLRKRKHRPHKPLAIMVPQAGRDGLDEVRKLATLTDAQAAALVDPRRSIVLATVRRDAGISPAVAPGLDEVGIMLPYSPLHHLLLREFGRAVIATSGNISGEPVITDVDEAEQRLSGIADGFLHHDRPICRPADDPVEREIGGTMRPIRLGRGTAPLELELDRPIATPTLAVGAFLKNTVALGWDRRVVVSPHIGDLDSPRGRKVFESVAEDLQSLYGVRVQQICCDAHPDYPNSRWARSQPFPIQRIYHHEAHASAAAGEFGLLEDHLAVTWDGTGLGRDGTIWGGELLRGRPGDWQRVGALRRFRLPGGERAAREGWRAALGLCWETGESWSDESVDDVSVLREAWRKEINCPVTTSAGRLFDAAAALVGLRSASSFEGQAPMELESVARQANRAEPPDLPVLDREGLWIIDWASLLSYLTDRSRSIPERALGFHQALAVAIARQAELAARKTAIDRISLSGGVFQNRLLVELLVPRLEHRGFSVFLPKCLPANDAAIAYGQIIEAAAAERRS